MSELRKVKYFLQRPKSFIPDCDLGDSNSQDELQVEKHGYFHCWVCEERKSAESGQFREETVALVEDVNTGKMYHVEYDLLLFIND